MKKFKLEAYEVLQRNELKSVLGGNMKMDVCIFKVFNQDGSMDEVMLLTNATDSSQWANNQCVDHMMQNTEVSRCYYDCAHDGFGQ